MARVTALITGLRAATGAVDGRNHSGVHGVHSDSGDLGPHLAVVPASNRKGSHPFREGLDQVTTERVEIYRCRLPEGLWVILLVQLEEVDDGIPSEAEIELAVRGLKRGRASGLSGMHTEDLKGWLQEYNCNKYLVRKQWELLVILINLKFGDETLLEELMWSTMVLLHKGRGSIRESALLR